MSDYKDRFEKWQKEARERIEQIDAEFDISGRIESGARSVIENAQKGVEKIVSEAEKNEAAKDAVRVAGETLKAAGNVARMVWDSQEPIRNAAAEAGEKVRAAAGDTIRAAGEKADEFIGDAARMAETSAGLLSDVFGIGIGFNRAFSAVQESFQSLSTWAAEKPLEAAAAGVSAAVGAGIGVVFTGLGSNWLFSSALPAATAKVLAERFDNYLKSQEEKIARDEIDAAEGERIRFESEIARRIGAPMLAGFSFASGTVLLLNVFNPKTVTGFPFGWLIGGNPFLEGIWFFGNGLICLKTSYDFFMIAIDDNNEMKSIIRELKGLLPATTSS